MKLRQRPGAQALPAFFLSFIVPLILAVSPAPRPISDVDRAGVELAASYLSGGPQGIVERIDPQSPLGRLSRAELLQEIETRLGPPNGARWQLATLFPLKTRKVAVFDVEFPSGADDAVTFELERRGGGFVIADIRHLAMPVERVFSRPALKVARVEVGIGDEITLILGYAPLLLGVLAALSGLSAAFASRDAATRRAACSFLAILLAFAALVTEAVHAKRAGGSGGGNGTLDAARRERLLNVRRAMASGGTTTASQPGPIDNDPVIGTTASLWHAQLVLQNDSTEQGARLLSRLPEPSNIPLAAILRARVATLKSDEVAAGVAYENAIGLGPARDTLWTEAAMVTMTIGLEERAGRYLDRLVANGSRSPQVYYASSILATMDKDDDAARSFLEAGWKLQPAERATMVEAGGFWKALRQSGSKHFINLSTPNEATFAAPDVSTQPIQLPAGATARVSGGLLSVRMGDGELLVPGGAALAPAATEVVDAGTWNREEEKKGLDDFAEIASIAKNPAAYAQPAIKRRILRAAGALALHNRWNDLLQLTEGVDPKVEVVPADMFFYRNNALERAGRRDEARRMVEQLIVSRAIARKNDARTLIGLGELLARHDMHSAAIKLLQRAQSLEPSDTTLTRIHQAEMRKRLATKFSSVKTEHFTIRYPEDVTVDTANAIGRVLEAELQRLQKWVPVAQFQPIDVNVVWWGDFVGTTGTENIIGYFQRDITVPFAGLSSMFPEAVAVLSHELCHAMIAQATNDQAPRWFHEGLASRVEMTEFHPNAFNMYDEDKLLALQLLDPVIGASPDPSMIEQSYIQSQTTIRYIEAKYGNDGVRRLLSAFRDGATTEEAIARLQGRSQSEFDGEMRTWGRSMKRIFDNPPPFRYDRQVTEDSAIRWSTDGSARPAVLGRQR